MPEELKNDKFRVTFKCTNCGDEFEEEYPIISKVSEYREVELKQDGGALVGKSVSQKECVKMRAEFDGDIVVCPYCLHDSVLVIGRRPIPLKK